MFRTSRQFRSFWGGLSSRSKVIVLLGSGVVVSATTGIFMFTARWRDFIGDAQQRYTIIPLSWLPWYRLRNSESCLLIFPFTGCPRLFSVWCRG